MIITISQYIEALCSPDGRTRSLRRLAPVYDEVGRPVLAMPGHGLVDFEVTVDGVRHTLRCPLTRGETAARRLRALAGRDRGLGGRFFTEWKMLESEIVLFDEAGEALEVDILVRPTPAGESLADFLDRAAAGEETEPVEAARRSFEELVRWADRVGRSGIALHRLTVDPDGAVFLTGFSATDERERIAEMVRSAAPQKETAPEPPPGYEEWIWNESLSLATTMAEGRWGVADATGLLLTTEPYEWLGEWSEGLLLAQKGGKCGFIDTTGHQTIPFIYDDASSFSEGCALVTLNGEKFFIDPRGSRI